MFRRAAVDPNTARPHTAVGAVVHAADSRTVLAFRLGHIVVAVRRNVVVVGEMADSEAVAEAAVLVHLHLRVEAVLVVAAAIGLLLDKTCGVSGE